MTLSEIRDTSRRLSRIKPTAASDEVVDRYINIGLKALATSVGGFYSERYIAIRPTFDISPIMAVDISIDEAEPITVALHDRDMNNLSGADVATLLQARLSEVFEDETITVFYDEALWAFNVTIDDATTISIEPPSSENYLDGTRFIFGTSGEQEGDTWIGETPKFSNAELAIPTDFVDVVYVTWEGKQLQKIPFQDIQNKQYGIPAFYAIIYDSIKLYPIPEKQGTCYMAYMAIPPLLVADTDTPQFPASAHIALASYAASKLSEEAFDSERASRYYNQFMVEVNKLRAEISNMNSETFTLGIENEFRAFRRNYQL